MKKLTPLVLALVAGGCESVTPASSTPTAASPAASKPAAFACGKGCGKTSGQPGACCGVPRIEVKYLCPECGKSSPTAATCCGVAMPAALPCGTCGKVKAAGLTCCGAVLR